MHCIYVIVWNTQKDGTTYRRTHRQEANIKLDFRGTVRRHELDLIAEDRI